MRHRWRWPLQLLSILAHQHNAIAMPVAALPLDAQIPPVAVVNQPFSFAFSDSTFSSAVTPSYSLMGAPEWLDLNGTTRTISGTPSQGDVGTVDASLVATDDTGSTTMPLTLVVSADRGPQLNASAATEFQTSGTVTDFSTILYHPSSSISVSFASGTFTDINPSTIYYATCANNTPLPSWLIFDEQNLSFTGLAPPFTSLLELPQSFTVRLAASNVDGYYTAQTTFSITLETHKLYFENIDYMIAAAPGQLVIYTGLQNMLLLDNSPVTAVQLKSVTAVTPTWLSFNNSTMVFSGMAPINVRTGAVAVFAEDVHGDTANVTVAVTSRSNADLIIKDIGPLRAEIGQPFIYTIDQNALASYVSTTLTRGKAFGWLKYDNVSLELSGTVPGDLEPQTINLTLTATQDGHSQSQIISLDIVSSHSNANGLPTTASAPVPTTQPPIQSVPFSNGNRLRLAAAIIIPIIALLALLLLLYCLRNKRQRARKAGLSHRPFWRTSLNFLRPTLRSQHTRVPEGTRYSLNERGMTPEFGVGNVPQITVEGLGIPRVPPPRPPRPLRPLSDIGQASRPGSFVSRLAHSRWSLHQHPPGMQVNRCSQCQAIAEENQAEDQATSTQTPAPSTPRGPRRPYEQLRPSDQATEASQSPMHQLRQSQMLGLGNHPLRQSRGGAPHRASAAWADLPGRRSVHGFGHGRPFPEQEHAVHARDDSGGSGGAWTDISGTSGTRSSQYGAVQRASSQGSAYVRPTQHAHAVVPMGYAPPAHVPGGMASQAFQPARPTIRPVGASPAQSEQVRRVTSIAETRSVRRPPSFQSYISARAAVVRRLRETDSTSFAGYRPGRKSSASKEPTSLSGDDAKSFNDHAGIAPLGSISSKRAVSSSGRDAISLSSTAPTPTIEEAVPILPRRLRPALDLADAQRVSAFYGSRNGTSSAQRKGSMIHNRFRNSATQPGSFDPGSSASSPSSPRPSTVMDVHLPATFAATPSPPQPAAALGATFQRHSAGALLGQPTLFPSFARRRSRSSAQSGGRPEPAPWAEDLGRRRPERARSPEHCSDEPGSDREGVSVPAPLRIRHSWAAGEEEAAPAARPDDDADVLRRFHGDEGSVLRRRYARGDGDGDGGEEADEEEEWIEVELQSSSPTDETITTGMVGRRPVSVEDADGGPLVTVQSLRAHVSGARRDSSMRFL